jgi:long-subunit acyl-CoA synthetase (AMP-forming)
LSSAADLPARLPDAARLHDGGRAWTAAEVMAEVDALAAGLGERGVRVLASLADNSPAWVVIDVAAARAGIVHVPLPLFFSAAQLGHALRAAGVDTVLCSSAAGRLWPDAPCETLHVAGEALAQVRVGFAAVPMPDGTRKVTFTSGTTGTPKGVCLGVPAMAAVADGLVQALEPLGIERHLCALPFAVLLENIAGVMAPLAAGATCVALPLSQLGLSGSSGFDATRFDAVVEHVRPNSVILHPQMLRAWVACLAAAGRRAPTSLRMVAVGGAAVGAKLIEAAHAVGIPAFEGYGLSEGASVQALNLPSQARPGSAGRALPHARIRIAADGEVEIAGSLFLGYLGERTSPPAWWPTGDLGAIDADGYLHLRGRKKLVLITAFGRNVSPEWVETALRDEPAILQAVVFGDGEPTLSAVLWPTEDSVSHARLQAAVDAANATLPDYARIAHWTRAEAPFTAESGMATPNGRPQRSTILRLHARRLPLTGLPVTPSVVRGVS